jgi:hypothetical protein
MTAPASHPIDTAPRLPGAPLLFWQDDGEGWCLGAWDGEGWFAESGCRLKPLAWARLPPPPAMVRQPDGAEHPDFEVRLAT